MPPNDATDVPGLYQLNKSTQLEVERADLAPEGQGLPITTVLNRIVGQPFSWSCCPAAPPNPNTPTGRGIFWDDGAE